VSFSKKGQIKIQQMAFVLVALMIFFVLVGLVYFTYRISDLRGEAESLGDEEAQELVRKLSGTAEFAYTEEDCANCIDLDKVLVLKDRQTYRDFWDLDYLKIKRVYPIMEGECEKGNYPNCGTITVIDKENFGTPSEAFVALCRFEKSNGGYTKCELGRIYASGEGIEND
tara:strand:- start:1655 stop:2164 length:510 start_codon:yes stop_codon:yes gene_type:complete